MPIITLKRQAVWIVYLFSQDHTKVPPTLRTVNRWQAEIGLHWSGIGMNHLKVTSPFLTGLTSMAKILHMEFAGQVVRVLQEVKLIQMILPVTEQLLNMPKSSRSLIQNYCSGVCSIIHQTHIGVIRLI